MSMIAIITNSALFNNCEQHAQIYKFNNILVSSTSLIAFEYLPLMHGTGT